MKRFIPIILIGFLGLFLASCNSEGAGLSASDGGTGVGNSGTGGSMAKFSISDNYLFLINEKSLLVYDISNPSTLIEVNKIEVDFGIETVFTLKERLFIGSINGVFIYDISNPHNIIYLSHYEHITACDPVVANDTLAFVTLNSQSECRWRNGANQLDVIDISNVVNPTWINSKFLSNPKGLAIDGNYVFVCDGQNGVEILDFSNPYTLHKVSGIVGIDAYDIILQNKILYLVGKDGLFQYDYTNLNQIEALSNILF